MEGFPFNTTGRLVAPVLITRLTDGPAQQLVVMCFDGFLYVVDGLSGCAGASRARGGGCCVASVRDWVSPACRSMHHSVEQPHVTHYCMRGLFKCRHRDRQRCLIRTPARARLHAQAHAVRS